MTQAILNQNNMDLLTNSQSAVCEKVVSAKNTLEEKASVKTDFDKIFKKQVEKENPTKAQSEEISADDKTIVSQIDSKEIVESPEQVLTLGDLKTLPSEFKVENLWGKFKEILSQATEEANVETSLDLTLAKDIQETIAHIKETVQTETENTENNLDADVFEQVVPDTEAVVEEEVEADESLDEETLSEVVSEAEKTPVFEQIITMLNKKEDVVLNQDTTKTVENESVLSKDSKTILAESQGKVSEILTKILPDENVKVQDKASVTDLDLPIKEEMLEELNIESMDAETDSQNQGSLMDNQTPEEQGIKASIQADVEIAENFDAKVMKATVAQNTQSVQHRPVDVNPSKILEQINKQMEGLQNNSKVNIVLNPESLGKVTIQLIKTGEGLSAQFTVNSQEVKDMLMKGLDGLKDTLLGQGVGVDNISVKVNDSQKAEYNSDWTEQEGSRGGNKEQKHPNKDEKNKNVFEQMIAQTLNEKEENGKV